MRVSVLQGGKRRRRVSAPFLLLIAVALAATAVVALVVLKSTGGGPEVAVAAKSGRHPVVRKRATRPQPLLTIPRRPRSKLVLRGRAAVLVDAGTGTVLYAKHPHARLPIASTTKIMTAVLALERLGPRSLVRIDSSVPRVAPFREGLRAGEQVEAWKLFYGLLLYSGNDDALALAIATSGSRAAFIALMNEKARRLGMRDSRFSSPSGVLDRGNVSSAWDMAALTRYAMWNPRFRAIVRTYRKRVPWAAPTYSKIYVNKNHLLGSYPGADGVKTGWTTVAQHCLVASARRHGTRLIAVVLASPEAYGDARRLLDFGFRSGA